MANHRRDGGCRGGGCSGRGRGANPVDVEEELDDEQEVAERSAGEGEGEERSDGGGSIARRGGSTAAHPRDLRLRRGPRRRCAAADLQQKRAQRIDDLDVLRFEAAEHVRGGAAGRRVAGRQQRHRCAGERQRERRQVVQHRHDCVQHIVALLGAVRFERALEDGEEHGESNADVGLCDAVRAAAAPQQRRRGSSARPLLRRRGRGRCGGGGGEYKVARGRSALRVEKSRARARVDEVGVESAEDVEALAQKRRPLVAARRAHVRALQLQLLREPLRGALRRHADSFSAQRTFKVGAKVAADELKRRSGSDCCASAAPDRPAILRAKRPSRRRCGSHRSGSARCCGSRGGGSHPRRLVARRVQEALELALCAL